jgi:hypothetical protein
MTLALSSYPRSACSRRSSATVIQARCAAWQRWPGSSASEGKPRERAELWASWLSLSESFLNDRLWTVSEDARRDFLREDRTNVERFLAVLSAEGQNAAPLCLSIATGRKGLTGLQFEA